MADKAEGAGLGEGKGSLLLSTRHPTLALALADGCCVALPAADRGTAARLAVATTGRPGTGGARGHKKRKKRAEGRWGPLLRWSAGDQRRPPSAEQEPMGSTLRSRRGAGCCPSFLHSAQLTAAEGGAHYSEVVQA